jgi:hypothetical protein
MKENAVSRRAVVGAMAGFGFGGAAANASESSSPSPPPSPDGGFSILASSYGVSPDSAPAENALSLQRAINASYGRRLVLDIPPGSTVRFDRAMSIEPKLHGNLGLEICGFGTNGYTGTTLQNVGRGDGIVILNKTEKDSPWNGSCVLRGFALHGDDAAVSGGSGIYAHQINGGFRCEDLWLDGHPAHAIRLERCFGMEIVRGFYARSRLSNILLTGPSNNIVLRHVRSFAAGRTLSSEHANIEVIASLSQPAAGIIVDGCDVSYGGRAGEGNRARLSSDVSGAALRMYDAVIEGRVHAALLSPELGMATSRPVVADFGSGTQTAMLDCSAGFCPAPPVEGTVFPFSSGLKLRGVIGLTCTGLYVEDCAGNGVLLEECVGFSFLGGLMQNSAIRITESATHGMVGGVCFRGNRAGIRVEGGARANLRIEPSNAMMDGARLEIA